MTKQKSPHTQTQQNTIPEQSDQEPELNGSGADDAIYTRMEGAETGSDRSPRKLHTGGPRHHTQPEVTAHEGSLSTRTPQGQVQGITSHSAEEESARQRKVVKDRSDATAGVNKSK